MTADTQGLATAAARAVEGSLVFVGTATVLIRYAGFTLLTDPNFIRRGERVGIGYGLSVRRRTDPALRIEELPPLDAVVLSHLHGDHFDRIAEERLDRSVPILTTPAAAAALRVKGFGRGVGLPTWESHSLERGGGRVRVTAMPGRHAPGPLARLLPPVMGSLLEFEAPDVPPLRVYISGDTLLHPALDEIPRRYPGIDLALLHLGGTRLLALKLTMDGEDGAELVRRLQPGVAIPIHLDDYAIFRSRLGDFLRAVRAAGLDAGIRTLGRGDAFPLAAAAGTGRRDAALDHGGPAVRTSGARDAGLPATSVPGGDAAEPAFDPGAAAAALRPTMDAANDYGAGDAARETASEPDAVAQAWAEARADEAESPLESPRDR